MDVAIRSLHLIAAAVWAGGLVMLAIVAGVARGKLDERQRIELAIVQTVVLALTLAILVLAADLVAS